MVELDDMVASSGAGTHERARLILVPGPGVSKPNGRKQIQRSRFRSAVGDADANQDIVAIGLRVLYENIEIAVLVEHSGVQEFVFGLVLSAPAVLLDQSRIGVLLLRILVEVLHIGVRRRAVEIEVILFDVFAVVAFTSCQAE